MNKCPRNLKPKTQNQIVVTRFVVLTRRRGGGHKTGDSGVLDVERGLDAREETVLANDVNLASAGLRVVLCPELGQILWLIILLEEGSAGETVGSRGALDVADVVQVPEAGRSVGPRRGRPACVALRQLRAWHWESIGGRDEIEVGGELGRDGVVGGGPDHGERRLAMVKRVVPRTKSVRVEQWCQRVGVLSVGWRWGRLVAQKQTNQGYVSRPN